MYMWENLDLLVEIPDVHVLILRQLPVFAASITIPLFSHASMRSKKLWSAYFTHFALVFLKYESEV